MMETRLVKVAAVSALAISVIGGFEGIRQTAYPDPASGGKPWTICYGHTAGVKPGDRDTLVECKALLLQDLTTYSQGVIGCTSVKLTDGQFVALTSFAYNVGVGTACRSSTVHLINQGKTREGCNALLHYNTAGGIVFPGLTRRRMKERDLCLQGVP